LQSLFVCNVHHYIQKVLWNSQIYTRALSSTIV
jgi:hypothetical protein